MIYLLYVHQTPYVGASSSYAAYYTVPMARLPIDPPRRCHLDLANERKAIIKYIFETHFHADFVSGHL